MTAFGRGEIYALAAAISWAIALIIFRRCGDDVRPFSLNLFKNGLAAALFIPVILMVHGFAWPEFSPHEWGMLAVSGFLGICVADTFFFYGLNMLGAGRIAIVDCFYVPFMVVLSMLMLDERLRAVQGVGAVLVVAGVGIAEFKPGAAPADRRRTWIGMGAGLTGLFLMAVAIIMVNPIIEAHPVLYVTEFRLIVGFATALPLLPLIDRRLPSGHWYGRDMPWRWMVLGTLIGVMLAMAFWISGFKYAPAPVVAVINQTHIFFVILFAAIFLREPLTPRKLIGAALGFGGVAIIALA